MSDALSLLARERQAQLLREGELLRAGRRHGREKQAARDLSQATRLVGERATGRPKGVAA